jgi:hypothetical protein
MGKRVCSFGDVPKGHHWMILQFGTIHTAGDERSRTHPGHGYPASDDPVAYYEAFTDEAEWKQAIEKLVNPAYGARKDFYAAEVTPATVTTSVSVRIGS